MAVSQWPVRLTSIAIVLFAVGFAGRLAFAFPRTIGIQLYCYGSGLLVLLVLWMRAANMGPRGILAFVGWLMLAILCGIAILTSGQ